MNSVYKLLIQIIGKDVGASKELKETKREVDTLSQATSKLGSVFSIAALTGVAYMGKQLAETAWEMGRTGAEALRMEASFGRLADRIDTTGDALLRSLRVAASGTVSDMDLMKTTAGLLASGIQTSTQDITDAMEIARLKAQQFGLTTTEAYDRMVTGARKFSVEMLDEIGINLRAESVYKRKADAMGVATSALTDAQKAESLWQAILEDGRREIEEYGGAVDDMATDIERASVAIENASLSAQMAMAPVVAGVAEMIPGAISRLQLLGAAFEGIISLQEYWTASAEAQRIEQQQGTEAAMGYMAAVIATGGAIIETADAQRDWTTYVELADREAGIFMGTLHKMPGALAPVDTALEGHIVTLHRTAQAYLALSDETKKWVAERTKADIAGMDPYEMTEGQLSALDAIDQQREDNARREEQRVSDYSRNWQSALDKQKQAYDELRSAVESALTPTSVTALDMSLSELGQYVDKWDENARRLDAIAQSGFAELTAHPDWAGILGIPDNVLAMGEEALKSWAAQTAASVRDLTRPDLLNVDAAVAAVEQYFADMAARELSIDLVTQAIIDKGIVSGPDAKKLVAQALGLDQTMVGETAGTEIFQGMVDKFREKSASAEFANYLTQDAADNRIKLVGAGKSLWLYTEQGILAAMEAGQYIDVWIGLLLPGIIAALGASNTWSGGGEP